MNASQSNRPRLALINSDETAHAAITEAVRSVYADAYVVLLSDPESFEAALPALQADAVILDGGPDGLSGLAALRKLRRIEPQLPVLALVPIEQELAFEPLVAAGADDYLVKTPRFHERLPLALTSLLDRSSQRSLFTVSQQRYRRLFASAPIGLFRCTPDGRLLAVNPALASVLGVGDPEDLVGSELQHFLGPVLQRAAVEALAQQEVEIHLQNGTSLWARVRLQPVAGASGEVLYYEGSLEDITEQRATQQALQESQEKLRLIFEHAFDGISIYEELPETGARRLLECNERYAEMAGYSKEELLRIGNTSLLQRKVSRKFSRAENLFIRQHKVRYRGLFSWIRPDGRENVIEYSAAPIDVDGRPLTIGIDRDITAHIRDQETAQRRAAHLEAINRIIRAGLSVQTFQELAEAVLAQLIRALQAEWGFLWIGETLVVHGLSEEEAQTWRAHMQQNPSPAVRVEPDARTEGAATRLIAPIHYGTRRLGGFMLQAVDVEDWPQDALALAQVVAEEVAAAGERLRLAERVQTQLLQMQMLMNASPEGMVLLDPQQKILLMNPAAQEILSQLHPTQVGDTLHALGSVSLAEMFQSQEENTSREIQLEEPPLILEATVRLVTLQERPMGWLLLLRNVTRRREKQQQEALQSRLAAVGQLAAGIAHDFNNSLAVMVLLLQMLMQDPHLSPESRERLETIQGQVQHASKLVQQILDFSRKSILTWSNGDLADLVRETQHLLQRTLADNVSISVDIPPGNYRLRADFTRLQQMLMNLAVNARDAMPHGGRLHFHLERAETIAESGEGEGSETSGPWLRLTVSDTGVGIPADVMPHIFEPFFTTKEVGQGSGLGLSQVYGIVKQHEGEITVESDGRTGSTFTIHLPALPSAPAQEAPATNEHPEERTGGVLMVVEDNRLLLEALCEVLQTEGFHTLAATSGEEALSLDQKTREAVDLLISDISMPGMNGLELHQALRGRHPTLRTILVSGYPAEREAYDWRQPGIVDWLQKPVSAEGLVACVRQALAAEE